jgi:hypothetical protein
MASTQQPRQVSDPGVDIDDEAAIAALLAAGDIEGARSEFERLCLESLDSGEPVVMTPEKWEQFRLELHREAKLTS